MLGGKAKLKLQRGRGAELEGFEPAARETRHASGQIKPGAM